MVDVAGHSSQHTSTAVAFFRNVAACETVMGSHTSGTDRRPLCMAADLAMARQRCVFEALRFSSSLTTEREQDKGTNPAMPISVAWRTMSSILSPLARPWTRMTFGSSAGASRRCAIRTTISPESAETISHSK